MIKQGQLQTLLSGQMGYNLFVEALETSFSKFKGAGL
jgi:hypothetical protein